MRKKKSRLSNWLSNLFLLVLLLIGLALIFNNQIKNYFIKQTGEAYAVGTIDRSEVEKNMEAEATFDFDAVEPASSEAVLRAQPEQQSFASDRRRGGSQCWDQSADF